MAGACYRRGVRRSVVGLLVLSLSTVARADDPRGVFGLDKKPDDKKQDDKQDDVRDVFGLGKKATQEPLDCSDGTEFPCVVATDPLSESESIYALSQWLCAKYLLSLPVASATQADVAHYALGANRDEAGPSFAGANGLENRWFIDGAPADGLRTGVADTRIPLTFLDGMWVTSGGFTARDRTSTGGLIDAELKSGTTDHELDAHVWAGWTAAPRQRPIVAKTYFARRGIVETGPDVAPSLVATGPFAALGNALGGTGWYAAGIAPELDATKFTWTAATITDKDNDGFVDGLPGIVNTEFVSRF